MSEAKARSPRKRAGVAASKMRLLWLVVWLIRGTETVCTRCTDSTPVTAGIFTPDGRTVVTGGADGSVRLWAPKKGTCRHVFNGHDAHEVRRGKGRG